ncbi:MAG: hypothetical protein EPO67_09930 [Reyranella sp.]|nr:MAG: hypothetical protein EPO67_09930 [Reyranella sp.]
MAWPDGGGVVGGVTGGVTTGGVTTGGVTTGGVVGSFRSCAHSWVAEASLATMLARSSCANVTFCSV